jgi:phosphoribosylanthranilate isomerase
MVKVKICGITNREDARAAIDFGADALGFVFFQGSPRYIPPAKARAIIDGLPPFVSTVGVFVDEPPETIGEIIRESRIDVIQLHGSEHPEAYWQFGRVVKAIRVKSIDSLEPLKRFSAMVSAFLLDAYTPDALGGTGRLFNWDIAAEAKQFGNVILAGGLTPGNVAQAVKHVHPFAVDVSSGVEREKGLKDLAKMRAFIEEAKRIR